METKKKVLFVGSFKEKANDGSVGGQMFACRTLVHSVLNEMVDFILIDTTSDSVPAPPVYKRINKSISRIFTFIKKLSSNKIDTAIIFSSAGLSLKEKGLMVFIAKAFKVKVIFAPRSGLILNETLKSSFNRFFLRSVVRSADIVICQGSSWKSFYLQFEPGNPEKFQVLLNWIDTDKYNVISEQRFKNTTSNNGAVKLLYLGWFEPYKGISEFLQAFEMLWKDGYKIEADVYGSGSLVSTITERVQSLGIADIFRLRGWANEAAKLNALKEADIFVLPSFAEGIPNALIEAMTSGLACISSNVGGVPDLIESGKSGLIFTPGDVNELFQDIVKLYQDKELRVTMGQSANKFTVNMCSIKFAVKYFSEIL